MSRTRRTGGARIFRQFSRTRSYTARDHTARQQSYKGAPCAKSTFHCSSSYWIFLSRTVRFLPIYRLRFDFSVCRLVSRRCHKISTMHPLAPDPCITRQKSVTIGPLTKVPKVVTPTPIFMSVNSSWSQELIDNDKTHEYTSFVRGSYY